MHSALARRPAVVLGVSTALFAVLAAVVLLWDEVDQLDVRFVTWVNRTAPESLVEAMRVATYAGSAPVLVLVALVSGALLARRGRTQAAALCVAATLSGLVTTQILKAAVRRARPELDEPYVQLTTYAFPSGHALAATATYGALAVILYSSSGGPRDRRLLLTGFAVLVAVVAASRVILGAHYLLDVLAGIAGGVALVSALLLALQSVPRRRLRRYEHPERARLDA